MAPRTKSRSKQQEPLEIETLLTEMDEPTIITDTLKRFPIYQHETLEEALKRAQRLSPGATMWKIQAYHNGHFYYSEEYPLDEED